MAKVVRITPVIDWAYFDKLGQYRETRPMQAKRGQYRQTAYTSQTRLRPISKPLNNKIVINQEISIGRATGPRTAVSALSRGPI